MGIYFITGVISKLMIVNNNNYNITFCINGNLKYDDLNIYISENKCDALLLHDKSIIHASDKCCCLLAGLFDNLYKDSEKAKFFVEIPDNYIGKDQNNENVNSQSNTLNGPNKIELIRIERENG